MFPWFFANQQQTSIVDSELQKKFDFKTESPLIIGNLTNVIIETVTVIFTTQFNSVDWSLRIQNESGSVIFLDIAEPIILDLQEYESNPAYKVSHKESIVAIIHAGTASEGEGIIKIDVR